MSIGIILTIFIIIVVFALIGKNRDENNNNREENPTDDFEETNKQKNKTNECEELFFEEVSKGMEKYKFLKIDNQFDLMFIKSLFQSENIPYYIEFENISRMRPGMYIGDLGNYNLVYILEKDYHDALKIVKKYIQGKKRSKINKNNKTENIRNFAEVLFANWVVPSSNAVSGIEILYKK